MQDPPIDASLAVHDFMKLENPRILHLCFEVLSTFEQKEGRLPSPWNLGDLELFEKYAEDPLAFYFGKVEDKKDIVSLARRFCFTAGIGGFPPFCAFLGGFIAQEIIKGLTNKYTPIKQFFYTDCSELIPELSENKEDWPAELAALELKPSNSRSDSIRLLLGKEVMDKIEHARIFMVGCGAIGCELLKNFAMINLGVGEKDEQH